MSSIETSRSEATSYPERLMQIAQRAPFYQGVAGLVHTERPERQTIAIPSSRRSFERVTTDKSLSLDIDPTPEGVSVDMRVRIGEILVAEHFYLTDEGLTRKVSTTLDLSGQNPPLTVETNVNNIPETERQAFYSLGDEIVVNLEREVERTMKGGDNDDHTQASRENY